MSAPAPVLPLLTEREKQKLARRERIARIAEQQQNRDLNRFGQQLQARFERTRPPKRWRAK
jgi:hypothetical protein